MLTQNLTRFSAAGMVRLLDDLTNVRVTCTRCEGFGLDRSSGTALTCEPCQGSGRVIPKKSTACPVCHCTVTDRARLQCSSCAC